MICSSLIVFFLFICIISVSESKPTGTSRSTAFLGTRTTQADGSLGTPFIKREPSIAARPVFAEQYAADKSSLLHMFLATGSKMWKETRPIPIKGLIVEDPHVPGSLIRLAFVDAHQAPLTPDDVAWTSFWASQAIAVEGDTSHDTSLKEMLIYSRETPHRRIAYLQASLRTQSNTGATINETSSMTTQRLERHQLNTTSPDLNLVHSSYKKRIRPLGRTLAQGTVHRLILDMISRLPWNHDATTPIGDVYRGDRDYASVTILDCTMRVWFQLLSSPRKISLFSDLDRILRNLLLERVVATNPGAFTANFTLEDDRGQDLSRPFVKIDLDLTRNLPRPGGDGITLPDLNTGYITPQNFTET